MELSAQLDSPLESQESEAPMRLPQTGLAVCFPAPANDQQPSSGWLPQLGELLPRRWRRQVVIQGQRFWLPD